MRQAHRRGASILNRAALVAGILAISAQPAMAKRLFLCVNPANPSQCTATIQAAIDKIPAGRAGGAITVAPGVYMENLNIPARTKVQIAGDNAFDTSVSPVSPGISTITVQPGAQLSLANINVGGGLAPQGGAIVAHGRMSLAAVAVDAGTAGQGGAIFYDSPVGTLNIAGSEITGNVAAGSGGGLSISGNAVILNSLIHGNAAGGNGGDIVVNSGNVLMRNTTLSSGAANNNGGGLAVTGGFVTLIDCSLILNSATQLGGGIAVPAGPGGVRLNDSTISGNTGNTNAGGVFNQGFVALSNTIIGENFSSGGSNDCSGPFHSGGFNLVQDPRGCEFVGITRGNVTAIPLVGKVTCLSSSVLQTQCAAVIAAASPAVGAGNPAPPGQGAGLRCANTDALGTTRSAGTCDIGAYQSP
ncbi:MAG: hypothetical protein ACLQDV_24735 [Candidatus Binataceae bacterium]